MNQPSLKDVTLVREHRMGNGSGNCDNGAAATADDKQALLDTEQVDSLAAELSPGSASAAQTEGRAASLVGQYANYLCAILPKLRREGGCGLQIG